MSFTLGDKTAAELGLRLLEDNDDPILPPTRDYTMNIPGKHGAWDFGADLEPKQFMLPCAFVADGTTYERPSERELQRYVRKLSTHLLDRYGCPKTLKLIMHREPDKFYYVRYSGSLSIERILYQSVGFFTLPLTAFDPYAYADPHEYDEIYKYDTGKEYDSGLIYPNTSHFQWAYPRHFSSLYNYGNLNTGLRIIIEGRAVRPNITNYHTGARIAINTTVGEHEALIIDSDKFVAVKCPLHSETYFIMAQYPARYTEFGDATSVIGDKEGDFFHLIPGENGLIFDGGDPDAQVIYTWYNKFS